MISAAKKLGDVVEFIRGITFKPEDIIDADENHAVVCMRTKNIQAELDVSDLIAVPDDFVKREELYLKPGDILISSANSWNLVGKVSKVPELPYRATAGGFIAIVRAKPGKIEPDYLYRWLASEENQSAIRACGRQTTNISNLSVPRFLDLPISVPEPKDQKRASLILEKTDSLRRKRQEAMRLADEFLKSLFFSSFGDIESNQHDWKTARLEEITRQITDGEHQTPRRSAEGIKLLSARNVQNGFLALSDVDHVPQEEFERIRRRCEPTRGDILISCSGTIGRVTSVTTDEPLALVRSVALVRPDTQKIRTTYLEYLLRSESMQRRMMAASKSSAQANLFQGPIRALPIILPPLELQEKFEQRVIDMQSITKKSALSLEAMTQLVQSLQHKFFQPS